MAYTQNPGRGNNSKTGHGVPSPLLQHKGGFPNPTDFLQDSDMITPEQMKSNRTTYNPKSKDFNPTPSGATYNANSGKYEPNKVMDSFSAQRDSSGRLTGKAFVNDKQVMDTKGGDAASKYKEVGQAYGSFVGDSLRQVSSNRSAAAVYNQNMKNFPQASSPAYTSAKQSFNQREKDSVISSKKSSGQLPDTDLSNYGSSATATKFAIREAAKEGGTGKMSSPPKKSDRK
jgi:hypothetical protein